MQSKREDLEFIPLDDEISSEITALEISVSSFTPTNAFIQLLDESIIKALQKHYEPPMSFKAAIFDGFYAQGKFSIKKTAVLGGSVVVGGVAAAFCLAPARQAAEIIAAQIKKHSGKEFTPVQVLGYIFQTANMSESTALSTLTAHRMILNYFGSFSEAEKFLKFHDSKMGKESKWKKYGRKTFDLASAIATNIPTYLLTQSTSIPLAFASALANVSLSWVGVSTLPLNLKRMYPARRIEATYLHEQIETFIKLPFIDQQAIMDEVASIAGNANETHRHKKIYARLLNLAKPVNTLPFSKLKIQCPYAPEKLETLMTNGLGAMAIVSELTFTEYAGVGVANLFANNSSEVAIMTGLSAAIFTLLPCIGFGYAGGAGAGDAMTARRVSLAELYSPNARRALKYLVNFINLFAGGTGFTMGFSTASDFFNVVKLREPLDDICKFIFSGVCYVGTLSEYGFYTLSLLDEIIIYFAERCGEPELKRLINFVLEARRVQSTIATMTDENYLATLTWKMQTSSNEPYSELSDLMHCLFDSRMSEGEFLSLQKDLNTVQMIVKSREELPHYKLIPSFFKKEAEDFKKQHKNLRKRKSCCHLFGQSHRHNESLLENSLELTPLPSPRN